MTLEAILIEHESSVRLTIFISFLLFFSIIEKALPARDVTQAVICRLRDNLGISVIGALILRLAPALLAANVALFCQANGLGLGNMVEIPSSAWLWIVFSIVTLDLAIYWQHRLFHHNKLLWRLHRVHHSDQELDATSALRFHPIEIVVSMVFKSVIVFTLGIPFVAVVIFEVILNACAIFNHANIRLPRSVERNVRNILITPSIHRIHHSVIERDSQHNFGFCLSVWDRLFRTYKEKSECNHPAFKLGVETQYPIKVTGLTELLSQPFKR